MFTIAYDLTIRSVQPHCQLIIKVTLNCKSFSIWNIIGITLYENRENDNEYYDVFSHKS